MRYPISPEYLTVVPDPLVDLYKSLEDDIFAYICEQLKTGDANEKTIELIRLLQRRGLPLEKIEKRIKKTARLTQVELDRAFDGAIERNRAFRRGVLDKLSLLGDTSRQRGLQAEISAIRRQTADEMRNISNTLGFALRGVDGRVTAMPIREAYVSVLDKAIVQIQSGAFSYQEAIRNSIRELSDSGLQWVDYPSGWHNRVDVAVRRAVVTGISQLSGEYAEALAEEIGTDFVEVSAHRGARDVGTGPKNHKSWQGKVYHVGGDVTRDGVRYKDFVTVTGYGTGEGLNGWNCRHKFYPFVPGVMERTYTDEELKNIDPPPFEFEGHEYTAYEATQKQRQIESAMRNVERRMIGYKAAGDDEAYHQARSKYRQLKKEYVAFSKAADLPTQMARTKI